MTVSKDQVVEWLENTAAVLKENKAYLTELDSAIGDADHGTNMDRGFGKVIEKLPTVTDKDIGNILKTVGMTLISSVGGAAGPLYGTFYMRSGMTADAKEELTDQDVVDVLQAGVDGLIQRGRAQLGDKTMVDVWLPSLDALREAVAAGQPIGSALTATTDTAEQAMKDTIPMQAKKGRASYLGERSIGHQDPGATSSYLIINELKKVVVG